MTQPPIQTIALNSLAVKIIETFKKIEVFEIMKIYEILKIFEIFRILNLLAVKICIATLIDRLS